MPQLVRDGYVFAAPEGQIASEGPFLAVCEFLDRYFVGLAARFQARRQSYPATLPIDVARRLGYFSSFPQLSTFAVPFRSGRAASRFGANPRQKLRGLPDPRHLLSPAVCYHTYHWLQNREIPSQPYCVTAAGRCFRFEGPAKQRRPLERLWNFTMREIVFFGTAKQVETTRRRLMVAVCRFLPVVRIDGSLREATDPFFLPATRGQRLLQQLRQLKYELTAKTAPGRDMALASFNHHGDFFGRRMNIRLPDGDVVHSGCVAFGLERWAYAFFCQNGLDPGRWPTRLRRFVANYDLR
jgi:seryl-tRNA synthetase